MPGLAYTSDLLANVQGGLQQDAALLGKLDATAELNGDALGLPGVTGFVNLQYVHGRAFSEEVVGDAQVTSNIEAVSALRPLEAWVEVELAGEAARVKAGLIDLNSEFDIQNVGALFLNSSHGIGPDYSQSGLNGPSIFPTTSGAVVLTLGRSGWTGRLGLFDAVSGNPERPRRTRLGFPGSQGLLTAFEVERSLGENAAVKAGVWRYSRRFDALEELDLDGNPRRLRGNRGAYGTIEGRIAGSDERSLDAWVRLGAANKRVNPIAWTVGGGATWGNDRRKFGVAVSRAALGGPARRAALAAGERLSHAEVNIEVTYSAQLREWLIVQPDLQYLVNPGWRRDLSDALVVGFRTIVEFP